MIQANIFNIKSIIKKIEQEKKIYIEAKKMIKDYYYYFEQKIHLSTFRTTTTGTSTSTT